MTIREIYNQYQIVPNLACHMLQVAAVGAWVADQINDQTLDKDSLTIALLLHDMGNIVKFKRPYLGEMADDPVYWEGVRDEFISKYGMNEHTVTEKIIKEIHPKNLKKVFAMYHCIGWHQTTQELTLEGKIADYADCSVSPEGIVGFEKRLEDLLKRYSKTGYEKGIMKSKQNAKEIEAKLVSPVYENTAEIEKLVDELRKFEIDV